MLELEEQEHLEPEVVVMAAILLVVQVVMVAILLVVQVDIHEYVELSLVQLLVLVVELVVELVLELVEL
jgi:hypothetical protein